MSSRLRAPFHLITRLAGLSDRCAGFHHGERRMEIEKKKGREEVGVRRKQRWRRVEVVVEVERSLVV